MMNLQELQTIKHYNLPVKVVIFLMMDTMLLDKHVKTSLMDLT